MPSKLSSYCLLKIFFKNRKSILTCVRPHVFNMRIRDPIIFRIAHRPIMYEMNILIKLEITESTFTVWVGLFILTTTNMHFNRPIIPAKRWMQKSTKVQMSFRHVSVTSSSIFTNLDVIGWNKLNFNYLSIIICVWEFTMLYSFHGVVAANQKTISNAAKHMRRYVCIRSSTKTDMHKQRAGIE